MAGDWNNFVIESCKQRLEKKGRTVNKDWRAKGKEAKDKTEPL